MFKCSFHTTPILWVVAFQSRIFALGHYPDIDETKLADFDAAMANFLQAQAGRIAAIRARVEGATKLLLSGDSASKSAESYRELALGDQLVALMKTGDYAGVRNSSNRDAISSGPFTASWMEVLRDDEQGFVVAKRVIEGTGKGAIWVYSSDGTHFKVDGSALNAESESVSRRGGAETGVEKFDFKPGDIVTLRSDPSRFYLVDRMQDWETIVPGQAASVTVPRVQLCHYNAEGDCFVHSAEPKKPEDVKKLAAGDTVMGDYIVYKDSVAETWKMLGTFTYRGNSPTSTDTTKILIGFIPDNFGGLHNLLEDLQSGYDGVLPVEKYVEIKRRIRNAGGGYRDFSTPQEFLKFQTEEAARKEKKVAELRRKLGL